MSPCLSLTFTPPGIAEYTYPHIGIFSRKSFQPGLDVMPTAIFVMLLFLTDRKMVTATIPISALQGFQPFDNIKLLLSFI